MDLLYLSIQDGLVTGFIQVLFDRVVRLRTSGFMISKIEKLFGSGPLRDGACNWNLR